MKTFVLVCISLQILCLSAKILPKNFPAFCSKSDPKYNKCMENALKTMGPHFLRGIKSINFPTMEPLTIPVFSINRKISDNIVVQAELKNLLFHGYDKLELREFNFDPNELKGKVTLFIPKLDFKMEYDIKGQLLLLNITNQGFSSGTATDLDLEFDLKLKKKSKVGVDYLAIDKIDVKGAIKDAKLKLIARDPALQDSSNFISRFFNENSKELLLVVDPIYEESLSTYYGSFLERFLSAVPADEIIPE